MVLNGITWSVTSSLWPLLNLFRTSVSCMVVIISWWSLMNIWPPCTLSGSSLRLEHQSNILFGHERVINGKDNQKLAVKWHWSDQKSERTWCSGQLFNKPAQKNQPWTLLISGLHVTIKLIFNLNSFGLVNKISENVSCMFCPVANASKTFIIIRY